MSFTCLGIWIRLDNLLPFIHVPILIPSLTLFITCCKYKLSNNKYNFNYLVHIWFDWSLKTDLNLRNIKMRYGLIYMLL